MTIGSIRIDRIALVAALLLTALYAFVGLRVLDPEAPFSIDAGIKYIQAKALRDAAFASTAIPYPARAIDPELRFLPFGPPFVLEREGRLQGIFPLAGSFIYAAVLPGGFPAMVLVSVAAAFVVMLTVGAMGRPHAAAAMVVLGACTWFWVYGVLLWEHLPALGFSTASWALVSGDGRRRPVLAGALLGAACCLRPESILLAPGFAILARRNARWRTAVVFAAAMCGPLLTVTAMEGLVYDRAPWVHVMHAVDAVWHGAGAADIIARPAQVSWASQARTVVGHWVVGLPGLTAALGVIAMLVVANRRDSSLHDAALLAVLVGSAALLGHDVASAIRQPEPIAGLFRGAPILLFAFLPVARGSTATRRHRLEQLAAVFFGIGLFSTTEYGGAQIGPRLLTPVLPMLAALSVETLVTYRTAAASDPLAKLVRGLGVVLLVGSVVLQVLANFVSLRMINSEGRDTLAFVRESGAKSSILVEQYLFNHVAAEYSRELVLGASTGRDAAELASRLQRHAVSPVVTMGRPSGPAIHLPGFEPDRSFSSAHVTVTRWQRAP